MWVMILRKLSDYEKEIITSNILTILQRITDAGLLKEVFPQFEWRHEYDTGDWILMYYNGPKCKYMMEIPMDYPIPFPMIDNIIDKWKSNLGELHAYNTATQNTYEAHAYGGQCGSIQIPLPPIPKPRHRKGVI